MFGISIGIPEINILFIATPQCYGGGDGPIWLDDLRCTGTEGHLTGCPSNGIENHNCFHTEDAGVRCSSEYRLYTYTLDAMHEACTVFSLGVFQCPLANAMKAKCALWIDVNVVIFQQWGVMVIGKSINDVKLNAPLGFQILVRTLSMYA